MSWKNGTTLDRVTAALAAAGDIAYEWDLASDATVWLGPVGVTL